MREKTSSHYKLSFYYSLRLFILFALIVGHVACSSQDKAEFPEKNWSYNKNPEKSGWNMEGLNKFDQFLSEKTHITGLVIVQKGRIIYEYGNIEENSYIASCRKSILSLLFGKYVATGVIDLNETLAELNIDDVTPLLPIEKQATIKDLLSARSGVFLDGSNGGDFRDFAPKRGSVNPGEFWLYSNWDFNTAGYIFEQETGKDIYREVEKQLAEPLHMQDWNLSLQRKMGDSTVSKFPAYHMWFSTRDMARIGLLMLNNGKWETNQVIPESWVKEVIKQRTSYTEAQRNVPVLKNDGMDLGYGYMWWLLENLEDPRFNNAYSAQGALGQSITIYPEIETVLAFKTNSNTGKRNSITTQMKIIRYAVGSYTSN